MSSRTPIWSRCEEDGQQCSSSLGCAGQLQACILRSRSLVTKGGSCKACQLCSAAHHMAAQC